MAGPWWKCESEVSGFFGLICAFCGETKRMQNGKNENASFRELTFAGEDKMFQKC
jgi:hypothetical protein